MFLIFPLISGEHLIRLINDLLDLSRAEIDALDLFPETFDPLPFLENVFRSMAEHVDRLKEVEWQLELPAHLPMLNADPVRLRQILLNLLHMPKNSLRAAKLPWEPILNPITYIFGSKTRVMGFPLNNRNGSLSLLCLAFLPTGGQKGSGWG